MKLTDNQRRVLAELRRVGRDNAFRYRIREAYLHKQNIERLGQGDQACTFGLGGLTCQVGHAVGMKPGAVLGIFKALERKGLVIRESRDPWYQRPLYWWPVGLAAELSTELNTQQLQEPS